MGCEVGSFNARRVYLRCLSSSSDIARISAASLTSGPIGVVFNVPVIDLACLFISR